MAKFRKARRVARRMFGKRSRSHKSASSMSPLFVAGTSAAYGIARPYVANIIPDISALGNYSDNVVIGGAAALAAWKGKGMIKKAGMIVLANESFIAASKASQNMGVGSTTGSNVYL